MSDLYTLNVPSSNFRTRSCSFVAPGYCTSFVGIEQSLCCSCQYLSSGS